MYTCVVRKLLVCELILACLINMFVPKFKMVSIVRGVYHGNLHIPCMFVDFRRHISTKRRVQQAQLDFAVAR